MLVCPIAAVITVLFWSQSRDLFAQSAYQESIQQQSQEEKYNATIERYYW